MTCRKRGRRCHPTFGWDSSCPPRSRSCRLQASAHRLSVDDPRRNLALITAAFGLGQMIGPALAGLLHDWTGSYLEPSLMAAAVLAAAAMLAAR